MKIFQGSDRPAADSQETTSAADVQKAPVSVATTTAGDRQYIKVDSVLKAPGAFAVAGWSTKGVRMSVSVGGRAVETKLMRVARPDVAAHLQAQGDDFGFVLTGPLDGSDADHLRLTWAAQGSAGETSQVLRWDTEESDKSSFGANGLGWLATLLPPFSAEWKQLVRNAKAVTTPTTRAVGFLDGVNTLDDSGKGVAIGWVLAAPGVVVWLESDGGEICPLDQGYHRFREDVFRAHGGRFPVSSRESGFLVPVEMRPGRKAQLRAMCDGKVHVLGEKEVEVLPPDPIAAAQWLFSIESPLSELQQRIAKVEEPLLRPLIDAKCRQLTQLPVETRTLGTPTPTPRVSVIVPLYGRVDFVEHQLIEFAADAGFLANAELIYVLDDPSLFSDWVGKAEELFRLYRVPFRWVYGNANRGFSGANNLGAAASHGEKLLFLNSDAFPQRPGWMEALADVLDSHPDIGAVGPRLLFADGSIQHAGMEFQRQNELGIWINHHPRMGLAPELDPHTALVDVPAVTGACMMLRRKDFEQAGGWDTGYLIGDFEDSDLCFKLRAAGLRICYLPTVQLTHLERQSFKLLGQGGYRTKVVIFNAARHQQRWAAQLETLGSAEGRAE